MVSDKDLITFIKLVTLNNPLGSLNQLTFNGYSVPKGGTIEKTYIQLARLSKMKVLNMLRRVPYNKDAKNYTTSQQFKNELKKL